MDFVLDLRKDIEYSDNMSTLIDVDKSRLSSVVDAQEEQAKA